MNDALSINSWRILIVVSWRINTFYCEKFKRNRQIVMGVGSEWNGVLSTFSWRMLIVVSGIIDTIYWEKILC